MRLAALLRLPHAVVEHEHQLAAQHEPGEEGAPLVAADVDDGEAVVPGAPDDGEQVADALDLLEDDDDVGHDVAHL